MSSLKEEGIKLLWERFINRVKSEWQEKYSRYGTAMKTVELPTKFARAVHADMVSYFAKHKINVKTVNYLTLHRYFQQNGFSTGVKAGTLDLFSMYLGYGRFSDFLTKNRAAILSEKTESLNNNDEKLLHIDPEDEIEINALIHEANTLEFHIYKTVPDPKGLDKLLDYFTAEGSAIQLIKSYINNALSKKRKLRIPGSFFYIEDIKIRQLSNNKAKVKTEEKWRLLWYRIYADNNDVLYDVTNNQTYHLKKIKGKWKIDHNDYSGKAEKITY